MPPDRATVRFLSLVLRLCKKGLFLRYCLIVVMGKCNVICAFSLIDLASYFLLAVKCFFVCFLLFRPFFLSKVKVLRKRRRIDGENENHPKRENASYKI